MKEDLVEKLVISPEEKGLLASLGIIIIGNLIKSQNRDIGNFTQGIGLGIGGGTIAHCIDKNYPSSIPHHDILALIAMPTIFILDKSNVIKNKDLVHNLYGIGLGALAQHLLTEGCSLCNTYYCNDGEKLC